MKTLLFCLFTTLALAQSPLQVVTKTIEKELTYADGQRVVLTAQKADVQIKGWSRTTVLVRLKLIAKHPEREVAERELSYLQYTLQPRDRLIELSNRFVIPQRAGTVKGNLKAIYEIWVPTRCPVVLSNTFGDVMLADLGNEVSVKLEFGKLTAQNLTGKVTVTSEYGDIEATNIQGNLSIKAEKAEIGLRQLGGLCTVQSHYGKLQILPDAALSALTVQATRTEILLYPRRMDDFQYDVENAYSSIHVPDGYTEHLSQAIIKRRFKYQPSPRKPIISIANSYSPIVVQTAMSGVTWAK